MTEICFCGNIMQFEIFTHYVLFHCTNCHSIKHRELDCEHNWEKLKVKISNGSFQARQACKNCYTVDPKIYKLKDFIDCKEVELQKIYDHRKKLDNAFYDRCKYLRTKYHESFEARYQNYISSEQWKLKRSQILLRDKHACQICGKMANEVHHLTYMNMEKEFDFELISLCNGCHINVYHPEKFNQ